MSLKIVCKYFSDMIHFHCKKRKYDLLCYVLNPYLFIFQVCTYVFFFANVGFDFRRSFFHRKS